MRICLVSPESDAGGEIGRYVLHAAAALRTVGHRVEVLLPSASGEWGGIPVRVAKLDFPPPLEIGLSEASRLPAAIYRTLLQTEEPFDYVEFADRGALGIFALRGKRYLGQFSETLLGVRLHGSEEQCRAWNEDARLGLVDAECACFEREAVELADVVSAPSHLLAGSVTRAVFIPPPFEHGPDEGLSARLTGNRRLILHEGGLAPRKGAHLLAKAFGRIAEVLDDVRVRFAIEPGAVPIAEAVGALLGLVPAELHHRVEFASSGSATEESTAICCFPAQEPLWDYRLIEAMSRGAAVVVARGGGGAELVEAGSSGLCSEADPENLARALCTVLDDEALASRLGAAAQRRVKEACAPDDFVRRLEEAVRRVGSEAGLGVHPPCAPGPEPEVSVVIPFFNLGKFLPQTLRSLDRQTFRSFEIILVDDGSSDPASVALVQGLSKPGLRIVRKKNGGLSSARNAGLAQSRGKYVLPLDADDLIAPTFLEKCVALMEAQPALEYATTWVTLFEDDPGDAKGGWYPWGIERDVLLHSNVAGCCTALFRRDTLRALGGYDEGLKAFEDWDLYCTLAERGFRGAVLPEHLFFYRYRPDSLVRGEGFSRKHDLRARIAEKHASLPLDASRLARLFIADAAAAEVLPLRYRVADSVNAGLKHAGIHSIFKRLIRRSR